MGDYEIPNLTSFLAYKDEKNFIDVKKLATATGEFQKNQYLLSFGHRKKKQPLDSQQDGASKQLGAKFISSARSQPA